MPRWSWKSWKPEISSRTAKGHGQLFERVRRRLISAFVRPASFFDRGQFSPALSSDVSAERFQR